MIEINLLSTTAFSRETCFGKKRLLSCFLFFALLFVGIHIVFQYKILSLKSALFKQDKISESLDKAEIKEEDEDVLLVDKKNIQRIIQAFLNFTQSNICLEKISYHSGMSAWEGGAFSFVDLMLALKKLNETKIFSDITLLSLRSNAHGLQFNFSGKFF